MYIDKTKGAKPMEAIKFTEIPEGSLPKKTLLIGGHTRWQKFFSRKFPKVKVIRDNDSRFDVKALAKYELILLNTEHMAHKQYNKVKDLTIPVMYVK